MNDLLKSSEQQVQWQRIWREILGEPTDDMPEDQGCDFALHFDIWDLELSKQKECFSLFPNGLKMLERANTVRLIEPKIQAVDDDVLLGHLERMNQQIEIVLSKSQVPRAITLNENKKKCTKRSVYRGNFELREEYLGNAIPPTDPLSVILRDLFEKQYGDEGYASYEFLFEPFYRTQNDTDIAESILWEALKDEYMADPYEPVIELFKVKAQAGWDEDGEEMFVFIEQ